MIHKNNHLAWLTCLPLMGAPLFAEPPVAEENSATKVVDEQTIVEAPAPEKHDVKYSYLVDKSANQMPGDAAMLFHIPGLTLTESGGPLSPSQIRYRGLSGARFRVDLEGL